MFKKVTSKVSFPELEESILQFWKEHDIFAKSSEANGKPRFMMFEGPPTANGSPGIHHVLARVFKDIICRYKSMKGFVPLRKGGWDTHGLPVELEVERELGLKSKRDIEEYGIEAFNQRCRESVFRYVKEWEELTDRIGFWVDMDHPYVTLDRSYIETVWWLLKQMWDRGLIYQGMKGTPHCPRCVSSLSSHEVALGYHEDTPDPSVYVKFRIKWDSEAGRRLLEKVAPNQDSPPDNHFFLAWTTTPWTLPGNTALGVNPEADYNIVRIGGDDVANSEWLCLAAQLTASVIDGPYTVVASVKGWELEGVTYHPLYNPFDYGVEVRRFQRAGDDPSAVPELVTAEEFTPRMIAPDFVSLEDGTGIVHLAPAFGDEDLNAGRENGLAFVQQVDLLGNITGSYPFAGKFVKDADEDIMGDLAARGLLFRRAVYRHTYPFCWRCATPLLYYAKDSWYIHITAAKDDLVRGNQAINWYPEHIKEGRFGEWLRNGVDWAISRERYWGTPIPFWHCEGCDSYHCVGTVEELKARAVPNPQQDLDSLDLHRPYVDDVLLTCDKCGGEMRRIPEVMDAWFDSGAMPFAQWNVTSPDDLATLRDDGRFPAEYICEAVDQTRGWFYSLLATSTLIAGEPSYRNVICLGLILDEKGRKMSKSLGNAVNPWDVLNAQGADAIRWYLFTATQPGDSRRFSEKLVNEVVRRFMLTLWNVYSFFVTYAEIDGYDPAAQKPPPQPASELDRWVLSELHSLVAQVDSSLESYDPTTGGRRIQEFVDLLSNWYVRRSRRRFWRSENDADKLSAYSTLYQCLVTLAKLMAPYAPFVAEELYQNLVRTVETSAPESVHLSEFPTADASLVDQPLMDATRLAMKISSLGRDARSRAGRKVRTPLQTILVRTREPGEAVHIPGITIQVLEELNVKELKLLPADDPFYHQAVEAAQDNRAARVDGYQVVLDGGYMVAVDTNITPALAREGLARELVHRIQNMRRAADFQVTDRITAYYQGPGDLAQVITDFGGYIRAETLADELVDGPPEDGAHVESIKIEDMELTLAVKRVA